MHQAMLSLIYADVVGRVASGEVILTDEAKAFQLAARQLQVKTVSILRFRSSLKFIFQIEYGRPSQVVSATLLLNNKWMSLIPSSLRGSLPIRPPTAWIDGIFHKWESETFSSNLDIIKASYIEVCADLPGFGAFRCEVREDGSNRSWLLVGLTRVWVIREKSRDLAMECIVGGEGQPMDVMMTKRGRGFNIGGVWIEVDEEMIEQVCQIMFWSQTESSML